jgi:hypothetical protein
MRFLAGRFAFCFALVSQQEPSRFHTSGPNRSWMRSKRSGCEDFRESGTCSTAYFAVPVCTPEILTATSNASLEASGTHLGKSQVVLPVVPVV